MNAQKYDRNPIVSSDELIKLFELNQGKLPAETQTLAITMRNGELITWDRESLEQLGVVSTADYAEAQLP